MAMRLPWNSRIGNMARSARAKDGRTPLHAAASHGSVAVADLLISKQVNVNARDGDGKTPLSLALSRNDYAMIQLLTKHGAR